MRAYLSGATDREIPSARIYSPVILPRLQSTLAALADLDCAYEKDRETVTSSGAPDSIKQKVIGTLQQRHRDARARYVRRLETLHRRAITAALMFPTVP
jgi:hypothetical protein